MTDQDTFSTELEAIITEMSASAAMPEPARTAEPANLPPDPEGLNWWRAKLAGSALAQYIDLTDTDREDALGDLLCNLMHLCDRDAELGSFDAQLERARRGYRMETNPDAD